MAKKNSSLLQSEPSGAYCQGPAEPAGDQPVPEVDEDFVGSKEVDGSAAGV